MEAQVPIQGFRELRRENAMSQIVPIEQETENETEQSSEYEFQTPETQFLPSPTPTFINEEPEVPEQQTDSEIEENFGDNEEEIDEAREMAIYEYNLMIDINRSRGESPPSPPEDDDEWL